MHRKVNVVEDLDGNKIVFIHDVKFKGKHSKDAKFGWYRYTSRFALPVYKERVLELDKDLETVALDEEGKKQFQERNLQRRKCATRKKGE